MYKIPDEYMFRLHHVRPRFKNDVDGVLIHVANAATRIHRKNSKDFDELMIKYIRQYGGNMTKTLKTLQNWRTEISSLFGLYIDAGNGQKYASDNAIMLNENEDSAEFFKYFLYTFQYPGGHQKPKDVADIINNNIKFKPARYILEVLKSNKSAYITKAEATHCIFNDLRVTRDRQDPAKTYRKIIDNREDDVKYSWSGDVIRYAGDILDYMVLANLLKKNGNNYSLMQSEKLSIDYFIYHDPWFNGYECLYEHENIDSKNTAKIQKNWFLYVNSYAGKVDFETNILEYVDYDSKTYRTLIKKTMRDSDKIWETFHENSPRNDVIYQKFSPMTTKQIGDYGEALVIGHERMRLKEKQHVDFLNRVIFIPNQYKIGYDITSYDPDDTTRIINIEVKTTVSSSENTFHSFHMTENEWNVANNILERYHVYRLQLRKVENIIHPRLCIIKNPVQLYKDSKINVEISNGADVRWKKNVGKEMELLQWID